MTRPPFAQSKGFTLIELLISLFIFSIVVFAVYFLFDQGSWFYLHSERRASNQQTLRLALEQLERDVRMTGFGVPTGQKFGDTTTWSPELILAAPGRIYFRADLDNRHSWIKRDVTATDRTINVENPELVCPDPGSTPLILADDKEEWQPLICSGLDAGAGTIDVSDDAMGCSAATCEIFTPEHIFYRLSGDADNNGICDNVAPGDEPFCSLERAIVFGNDPVANSVVPADDAFETLATNIVSFDVQGTTILKITITARDREMQRPREYQDFVLTTEVLVRDAAF